MDGHLDDFKVGFDLRGYAIAPLLLPSALTFEMIALIENTQSGIATLSPQQLNLLVLERDLPASKRGGVPADEVGDAIFILGDPPAFNRRFAAAIVDPAVVDLARQLLGTQDIRYHFSNITMKRERVGSGISWHRDYPNAYMCPTTASFVRLMICLDGMDADNGATQFVVGSHQLSDAEAKGSVSREAALDPAAVIVSAICPPGSVVAIHPKVVHGGQPNTSPRQRRNLVIQWGRADDPIATSAEGPETLTGFSVEQIRDWIALL
jgi:phytanoyl-CoA hydroxylase